MPLCRVGKGRSESLCLPFRIGCERVDATIVDRGLGLGNRATSNG